jgi:malonyl-CoA O-methyltransferase
VSRVSDRFDAAAATYAAATPIQRQVVAALAERIAASGLTRGARVAEFGCGVGYLPQALWPRLAPGLWIATDLAPAMAIATARALPAGGLTAVMDAARPALAPGFDLVCSSLTLQWLDDPVGAVAAWRALVKPGGRLAVATLTDGSFRQWRAALAQAGVADPRPAFPTLQALRGWFQDARIETVTLTDRHATALAFARAAKASGIDAGFGRPLDAGAMRKALRAFEAGGAAVTYEVALIVETRPSTVPAPV